MNTADIFVKTLETEGVKYIFGVPGEENLDLLESIRNSNIKFIPTRHEQAAGIMAATIGRLTGNPGVALSTLGPGATNLMTAVAYAQLGGMPTLFITGQKPIKSSKQGHFQIIDTVGMIKPLTKMTRQIMSPNLVASTTHQAIKLARDERPGAVHLELPEDVAAEEIDDYRHPKSYIPRRAVAEAKAINDAIKILEGSNRPIIIIGSGANRKRTSKMLNLFLDKTHIPFCATQMGKGVVSETRSEYLGTTALSTGDYIHDEIAKADTILYIGHDTIEKPPFLNTGKIHPNLIHLNFSPASTDLVYSPDHEVIGDIANAIWQLTEKITPQPHWQLSDFKPVKDLIEKNLSNTGFSPISLITTLRKNLGENDIVTLDNGMYKLWFARHYETYTPNTLLLDNALATMGAGLPSAIATKLVNSKQKVVAVVGDGGFMMSLSDLETAKRLSLDLVIIILHDNRFGMIDWKQASHNYPSFGLEFGNPDFVQLAQAYGLKGYHLNSPSDFNQTLELSLSEPGIHLIDYPIDYSDNQYLGKKA